MRGRIVVIAAAMALALAACSSDSDSGTDTAGSESTTAPTESSAPADSTEEPEPTEGEGEIEPEFAYSGPEGPESWEDLPDGADCAGSAQSPIDLTDATGADLADIGFAYVDSDLALMNRHSHLTVQADLSGSDNRITIPEGTFKAVQFHFHAASEHTIGGVQTPLEMHIVHQEELPAGSTASPRLAVVGVMINVGEADNEALADVFDNVPEEPTVPEVAVSIPGATVNLDEVLPTSREYYGYEGSLTTPPCTEGVLWHVLAEPIEASQAQLDELVPVLDGNFRPVQGTNGRSLELDTTTG